MCCFAEKKKGGLRISVVGKSQGFYEKQTK